jgi:shikimate dehydrogenase|tara:strand:+ start:1172 stop:2044 length:873 start_codon:yes stop_codon:yes gene_type:complete
VTGAVALAPAAIRGSTQILGVIGDPIGHSASPAMHNAALAHLGLDYVYVPYHVKPAGVSSLGPAIRSLGIRGLNVTVPHKTGVMAIVDDLSEAARQIGAVNTIIHQDGHLTGDNTDAYGIAASLREDGGLSHLPSHVVLLGAGGAARAVLHAVLQDEGVEHVTVQNRTMDRATALAQELGQGRATARALGDTTSIEQAGLLINCSSVGLAPEVDVSPVGDGAGLHQDMVVVDIVYKPLRTRLLQQAEAVGARTVDGLGMLVHQAARAFELWTGQRAPVDIMRQALLASVY